jgi:hypothetical protein
MAMDAFSQASRATDDPQKQAVARATEILIRRSKPLGYVPRTARAGGCEPRVAKAPAAAAPKAQASQPIPIMEAADRKQAFAALFADEFAVVDPKVKAATKSNALPPVIDAIKSVGDLRAVEIAANGSRRRRRHHRRHGRACAHADRGDVAADGTACRTVLGIGEPADAHRKGRQHVQSAGDVGSE